MQELLYLDDPCTVMVPMNLDNISNEKEKSGQDDVFTIELVAIIKFPLEFEKRVNIYW